MVSRIRTGSLIALAALATVSGGATAQDGYLFRVPVLTLSARAGASLPMASDDLHEFWTRELTLERKDFQSSMFGIEAAVRVSPQVDLTVAVARAKLTRDSESRDWVFEDDRPIEQTTELSRTPVSLGARYFLLERGRSVSRHAWVPVSSLAPYIGGGLGVMFYELKQDGHFVDFETLDIFLDHFESSGSALLAFAGGGVEWWPWSRVGLTVDGRYNWAKADLERDFDDFNRIDLRGFQFTAGLAARF